MSNFINHNSFLLAGILVLVVAGYRLFKDGFSIQRLGIVALIAAVILVLYLFLKPAKAFSREYEAVRSQIGAGTPVLLELQSPF